MKRAAALALVALIGFGCATGQTARHKPRPSRAPVLKPAVEPPPRNQTAPTETHRPARKSPDRAGLTRDVKGPSLLPTHFNRRDRSVMVLVPTGKYTVGLPPQGQGRGEEAQGKPTALFGFYIDRNEVSVAQYRRFDPAYEGNTPSPCPTCPATGIDWFQASRYCHWAGKRLPKEAEWEAAARGPGNGRWPWGTHFVAGRANLAGGDAPGVRPAGDFPAGASPFGALDMAGNVWEWVRSPLGGRAKSVSGKQLQVAKGGGYPSDARAAEISFRNFADPAMKHPAFGFRCAKYPPPAARR